MFGQNHAFLGQVPLVGAPRMGAGGLLPMDESGRAYVRDGTGIVRVHVTGLDTDDEFQAEDRPHHMHTIAWGPVFGW